MPPWHCSERYPTTWDNSDVTGIIGESKWSAMLEEGEKDATDEEIAAAEAEHGPFLPADGEG